MKGDADLGAFEETVVFLEHFKDFPDPRQAGKVVCRFDEVLLLSLLAVLAGAETFTDIALFGEKKLGFLRRFRPFACGTPPHDRLGEIFAALDAGQFQRCFVAWVAALTGVPEGVVAIDGKTVRRPGCKTTGKAPIHIVPAFAARQRLVTGQVKVAEKSNEITAIPRLLDMLAVEGAIVTIDSMGCQRAVADKILAKKAGYILALKGNQGTLHEDVKLPVAEQQANDFKHTDVTRHETVDGGHGRIETRKTTVIHNVEWLQKRHDWPGLQGVAIVESRRETGGGIQRETRLHITSLTDGAAAVGPAVRDHRSVENNLHWTMDMMFRDDECRVRTGNAPANFTTVKHMALNLLGRMKTKQSLRARRKSAAWDDDFLASAVTG